MTDKKSIALTKTFGVSCDWSWYWIYF